MVWSFDPSIHTRLEQILARPQDPTLGKQSIWYDRSAGTKQVLMIILRSVAVSLSIDVPKYDVTADEALHSRHRSDLKVMLQSPCHLCKTYEHNVHYQSRLVVSLTRASLSLIDQYVKKFEFELTAIVETVLLTWKHCYTLLTSLGSWCIPQFLDHCISINAWWLLIVPQIIVALDQFGFPRSMLGSSISVPIS